MSNLKQLAKAPNSISVEEYKKCEAMDRTDLAIDYIENTIIHHSYYRYGDNLEFKKLVDEAMDKLIRAYQVLDEE